MLAPGRLCKLRVVLLTSRALCVSALTLLAFVQRSCAPCCAMGKVRVWLLCLGHGFCVCRMCTSWYYCGSVRGLNACLGRPQNEIKCRHCTALTSFLRCASRCAIAMSE